MFATESSACRIATLGHAIVVEQQRYKQTIFAAVTEHEQFMALEGNDTGNFTDKECLFHNRTSNVKWESKEVHFRDAPVRDLFLKCSPCILGKCRETRFRDVVSSETQHFLFTLIRGSAPVNKCLHWYQRFIVLKMSCEFGIKLGVNRELFKNCVILMSIVDQNVCKANYHHCLFAVFKHVSGDDHVNGKQTVVNQGFIASFKEKGGSEFLLGLARVLRKCNKSKLDQFMYHHVCSQVCFFLSL